MNRREFPELDETLKLLTSLHDNSFERMEICKYVQENDIIAVFAYGSLLWNPVEHVERMIFNCTLDGYTKGFICDDFIYRGTTDFTGLTMGLQEDPQRHVSGALLISSGDKIIPFLNAFVKREIPVSINGTKMDIYRYDFVKVVMPDGMSIDALTCVVNKNSLFYSSRQLTLDEQAQKMARLMDKMEPIYSIYKEPLIRIINSS